MLEAEDMKTLETIRTVMAERSGDEAWLSVDLSRLAVWISDWTDIEESIAWLEENSVTPDAVI